MKILLMGHRGVGKTLLLQRLIVGSSLHQSVLIFDLDREIEKRTGLSVFEIFQKQGEKKFREMELEIAASFLANHSSVVLAVGGGFQVANLKRFGEERIWVRRTSDIWGRILPDRPRLHPELSFQQEWQKIYSEREKIFLDHADRIYDMPEGLLPPNQPEYLFFGAGFSKIGGGLSLRRHHLEHSALLEKYLKWGFDFFEIRDDVFDTKKFLDDHQKFSEVIPSKKQLFAFRRRDQALDCVEKIKALGVRLDWAMELGPPPISGMDILSSHGQIPPGNTPEFAHLKWSPVVDSWLDLEKGLAWQQQDPKRRSYLPRSLENRRWAWVRRWLKGRQQLHFIQDGFQADRAQGIRLDQPTIFEWTTTPWVPQKFAAVLGAPIEHSFSPAEHFLFFAKIGAPYWPIEVSTEDFPVAFRLLEAKGLHWASVTSPLKKLFLQSSQGQFPWEHGKRSLDFQSTNTVWREGQVWKSDNTDGLGFSECLNDFGLDTLTSDQAAVIWGGGGALPSVQACLRNAKHIPVRARQFPDLQDLELLVWAASADASSPPLSWKPKQVLDLNYRADSRAIEYALATGAKYFSGLRMFQSQAAAQQNLWRTDHDTK